MTAILPKKDGRTILVVPAESISSNYTNVPQPGEPGQYMSAMSYAEYCGYVEVFKIGAYIEGRVKYILIEVEH